MEIKIQKNQVSCIQFFRVFYNTHKSNNIDLYFKYEVCLDPPGGVELRVAGSLEGVGGPVSGRASQEQEVECLARGGSPAPTILWSLGDTPLEASSLDTDASG